MAKKHAGKSFTYSVPFLIKMSGPQSAGKRFELFSVVRKAVANPLKILQYLLLRFRTKRVKRIERDGEVFYRYKGKDYPEYLNCGNATSFILEKAKLYCSGKGIDVGADAWPFPGAKPIQNEENQNAYKLDTIPDGSLDFVFSSHCLEHLKKWKLALKLWVRKLRKGGILFLYLPHPSMRLWNRGAPWVGYGHAWVPECKTITKFLSRNDVDIIDYNANMDLHWGFHIVGKKK